MDYDNGGVIASFTQLEIWKIVCLQIYSLQLKNFDCNWGEVLKEKEIIRKP